MKKRWLIESGILDLAAAILMLRWIRKQEESRNLGGFEDQYLASRKYRKVVIIVDLVRRLLGSQAFFFFALTLADKHSWIGRHVRVLWTAVVSLLRQPRVTAVATVRRNEYPVRFPGD